MNDFSSSKNFSRSFFIFIVSLVILLGADLLAIQVGGMRFRVAQVIVLLAVIPLILSNKILLPTTETLLIFLFAAGSSLSIANSLAATKSIGYIAWIFYNYIIVFGFFYYINSRNKEGSLKALHYAFRLETVAAFALYALGIQKRASLLFLEPSYFSIHLIPFLAIAITNIRKSYKASHLMDILLIAATLVATKSAMLAAGFLITLAIILIFDRFSFISLLKMAAILLAIVTALYFYAMQSNDLLTRTFSIFTSEDETLGEGAINRGGNRYGRTLCAFDIFKDNFLTGVGIGAYEPYLAKNVDTSKYNSYFEFENIDNLPATNIYLELLATTGIAGGLPFLLFLATLIWKKRPSAMSYEEKIYFVSFLSTSLILNVESNYLRLYYWMLMGALAGAASSRSPFAARAASGRQTVFP